MKKCFRILGTDLGIPRSVPRIPFPKYSEGMHKEGSSSMVVSRGLGNSTFPFRIFNRPELIVVDLQTNVPGVPCI